MTLSVALRHRLGDFALDVAFDAPAGVTVLFGRSGSGKTTIANAVAGLTRPDHARISVAGRVLSDSEAGLWLPASKRRLGYIFQEGRLFPHLNVRQNLRFGAWFVPRRMGAGGPNPKDSNIQDMDRVVDMLGIGALLDRQPGALSGGEKQRVAIGRALLSAPDLLIADEPLAALDEARKAEILPYFERLRDEISIPILYVSHAPTEVARLATTVVVLQDGKTVRQGSAADIFGDPQVRPTGVRAIGAVLEAQVIAHHDDGLSELDAGGARLLLPRVAQAVGQKLRIRIPGQDVILSRTHPKGLSALNVLHGTITGIRAGEGPGAVVSIKTNAGTVLARVTRRSSSALRLAVGVECYAIIKTLAIAPEDVGGAVLRD